MGFAAMAIIVPSATTFRVAANRNAAAAHRLGLLQTLHGHNLDNNNPNNNINLNTVLLRRNMAMRVLRGRLECRGNLVALALNKANIKDLLTTAEDHHEANNNPMTSIKVNINKEAPIGVNKTLGSPPKLTMDVNRTMAMAIKILALMAMATTTIWATTVVSNSVEANKVVANQDSLGIPHNRRNSMVAGKIRADSKM